MRTAFWAILLAGFALRFWAAAYSAGIVHPDEHQQYLEAAQGIVYGYNVTFWEYDRGTRHYCYPGLLAGLLYVLEAVGVRDPIGQATVIRVLIGLAVLGSTALVAHDWLRKGRTAGGLFLITLAACSPDMVFVGVRTLSETVMIVPLMLGYLLWRRDPLLAGIFFGMMFAIRFQSAFFTAMFFAISATEDLWSKENWRRWHSLRMLAGLTIALLWAGWIDWLTWGNWFHSSIECFRANIFEGKAAGFGTEPWYWYLESVTWAWLEAVPFAILFFVLGAVRNWRLGVVVFVFFFAHSLINYLVVRPEHVGAFDDVRLEEIEVIHGWGIYKVHRSSRTAPVSASADGS